MDTSKLIDNLTRNLKPVRPLPAPVFRALHISLAALALVAVMIFILGGPRADWHSALQNPVFMSGDLLMLVAGFVSAIAGLTLAVPDTRIRKPVIALLCAATGIWIGLCIYATASLTPEGIRTEMNTIATSSACLKALVFMSALPLVVSFTMVLRAAPVWRGWTGYALTLSMASFGAFGMQFFCPNDSYAHLLLWHFMPVVILSGIGAVSGIIVLRLK